MKKISIALILSVLLLEIFLTGCQTQEVVCNEPYIKVGTACCLDQNDNNICDNDENSLKNDDTSIAAQNNSSLDVNIKETCSPNWDCSEWSECSLSGKQTRTCSDENKCGTSTNKPKETQSCTPPIVEPEPITLSGSGQEASDIFELIEGIAIFEMENTGNGHFGIWLMDEMGNNVELLVNEIGPFDGSKIARMTKMVNIF